jgi:anaerobic magnesium-protoporphyrin IX monomethyl ester cyclase
MRIALIQPDSPYLTYPFASVSLGLLYISAYLKQKGIEVMYYDLTGGRKLPKFKADIVAFTCQITQFLAVKKMRDELAKEMPDARFVIGGPFPTHSPELCTDFYVIQGEGEEAMLQLVQGIDKPYGYVDPNFMPDWNAVDLKRYGYGLEGKRCINIMTKRGNCPYKCTFCAKQETGTSKLRLRTAENVLEEVDFLRTKGFEAIAIYDDDVLLDKVRDKIIFEGLKKRGMPYRCMTRTNLATKEDLKMLKDTGCAELAIGVESADPYIHNVVCNKGTTIQQDTEFVKNCKRIGLRVKTYLIIGLPGESLTTVKKTALWLEQVKPDNFDVSIFTPYPGSDIYRRKKAYDISWDEEQLRAIWFSGEAQYGSCAVSTSRLTSKQILELKGQLSAKRGLAGSTTYWRPL